LDLSLVQSFLKGFRVRASGATFTSYPSYLNNLIAEYLNKNPAGFTASRTPF